MKRDLEDNYSKIRKRFNRRFSALQDWLADPSQHIPKAWYESGNPIQSVPISKQLPIYQPDKRLTPQSLSAYLQEERQAHQGARLLSIPLYINQHWVVLTLYIDKDNQLSFAAYIDSVIDSQENMFSENQSIPLKRSNPLYQSLQSIYPNFDEDILQYQYYVHEGNDSSEFAMVENAGQMVKRFYFGHRFPVTSTLWSEVPTFEQVPDELRLYITGLLGPVSQAQLAASSRYSRNIAKDHALDQSIWKRQYDRWMRYLVPPIPNAQEPKCYKKAFKRLYLSLSSLKRILIKAALEGDQAVLDYYFLTKYERSRHLLLIIATIKGDITQLKRLLCDVKDLKNIPLISFSMHSPNRQKILDYFWFSIIQPYPNLSYRSRPNNSYAHWAAMLNQVGIIKEVIVCNPELIDQANDHGITPYMFAKYFGHADYVAMLEQVGISSNMSEATAFKSLYKIFCGQNLVINSLLVLLAHTDSRNMKLNAMGSKFTGIIRLMLAYGINIEVQKNFSNSILHYYLLSNTSVHAVKLFLAFGFDPYLRNTDKDTALDIALHKMKYKTACLLAVAMFLKALSNGNAPTLQEAHDYHPRYFRVLIREILDSRSPWLWITDEMRDRLKASPLVKGFEYQKKIEFRLRKKLRALPEKLANPTEQIMPKAWLEDPPPAKPLEQQLPIYHPSRKIIYGVQGTLRSLSNYLQYEQKQHNKERLLVVPIYVKDHWAVFVLRIDENNQPAEAHFVDSLGGKATHLNPLYHCLHAVYPNFQGPIQQHQRYYHSDKSLSEFIMIKNAEEVIKHIYFEDRYRLTPIPWTSMLAPTFESVLPEEIKFGIISRLGFESRMQISATSQDNRRLADNQELWKRSYQNWSRYVIPPAPGIKKPTDYKTAFKKLYLSIPPLERKLIKAVIMGDKKVFQSFVCSPLFRIRNRLLVIAACDGNIELLKRLKCNLTDLRKLPLVQYSIHAKNYQSILNYFWTLVYCPRRRFRSSVGNELIHWAAMLNQVKILKKLLQTYPKNTQLTNNCGITPKMFAEYYGHIECVRQLKVKEVAATKEEEWNIASISRKLASTRVNFDINNILILLAKGIDVKYERGNRTALIDVVLGVGSILDIVFLLLTQGEKPNINGGKGDATLKHAVAHSNIRFTRALLIYGANPNVRNENHLTALMMAVSVNSNELIQLLLAYDADPFLKNDKRKTALDLADEIDAKCLLLVAMYLKTKPENKFRFISRWFSFAMEDLYLKQAHHYSPAVFKKLIQDILEHNKWPWVTKEMKQRLLNDPFVRSLDLTMQSEVSASVAQKGA